MALDAYRVGDEAAMTSTSNQASLRRGKPNGAWLELWIDLTPPPNSS